MPRSDFSSSCGSEKLYGNGLIDPPNGLGRCGEFVSVITSCRSASRRWAMYLPEKPKAPVTAIRTLVSHEAGTWGAGSNLLRLDVRCSDHLGRFLGFGRNMLSELGWRIGKHDGSQVGKLRLGFRVGERGIDLPVELVDDFGRRAFG